MVRASSLYLDGPWFESRHAHQKNYIKIQLIGALKQKRKMLRTVINRFKTIFWFFERPIHPYIRDFLLKLHIIHHHGRQPFHIGWLAPNDTAQDLRDYLVKYKGFEDHFPCWVDDGETVDLRFRQNFDWQYHLRIFDDREVRGHHEYTPESRPIAHLTDRDSTACTKEFMNFLGTWVVQDDRSQELSTAFETCPECHKPIYPSAVTTS